jgi:ABC-type amino acid transport substrate-binding protein
MKFEKSLVGSSARAVLGGSCVLVFVAPFLSFAQPKTQISVVGDVACPIVCSLKGEKKGVFPEVAEALFKDSPFELKIHELPWMRAVQSTLEGKYTMFMGGSEADGDALFPDLSPMKWKTSFLKLNDNPAQFKGVESLKGIKVGGG